MNDDKFALDSRHLDSHDVTLSTTIKQLFWDKMGPTKAHLLIDERQRPEYQSRLMLSHLKLLFGLSAETIGHHTDHANQFGKKRSQICLIQDPLSLWRWLQPLNAYLGYKGSTYLSTLPKDNEQHDPRAQWLGFMSIHLRPPLWPVIRNNRTQFTPISFGQMKFICSRNPERWEQWIVKSSYLHKENHLFIFIFH